MSSPEPQAINLKSSPTSNCAVLRIYPATYRPSQGQTPPAPPPLDVGRHANVMICHAGDVPPSRQLPASSRDITLQCSHQSPLQPESFQAPGATLNFLGSPDSHLFDLTYRWYLMEIRWRSPSRRRRLTMKAQDLDSPPIIRHLPKIAT